MPEPPQAQPAPPQGLEPLVTSGHSAVPALEARPGDPAAASRSAESSARVGSPAAGEIGGHGAPIDLHPTVSLPPNGAEDVPRTHLEVDEDRVRGVPGAAWVVLGVGSLAAVVVGAFLLSDPYGGLLDGLDASTDPDAAALAGTEEGGGQPKVAEAEETEEAAEGPEQAAGQAHVDVASALGGAGAPEPAGTTTEPDPPRPADDEPMEGRLEHAADADDADGDASRYIAYRRGPQPAMSQASVAVREKLRGQLLGAYKAGKYKDAVDYGRRLAAAFGLDCEAEYTFAQSLRAAGYRREAFRRLEHFVMTYQQSVYADDAIFWMGNVLRSLGQDRDAREYFRRVATDPASNWRQRAQQLLRQPAKSSKGGAAGTRGSMRPTSKHTGKTKARGRSTTASL